ncbi:MAG: TIGR01777 family oxidoreductase [Akkermansiaceae bacterium]|nr:TIGR01777 family oxidoreductase [Akkermansiaceae bacterium]
MNATVTGQIVIFGANGFLGRYLCRYFARQGREVVAVGRHRRGWSGDGMFLEWDGRTEGPWIHALEGAAAVINLSGRSVDCRYTPENRRRILDSRVASTAVIGRAIGRCQEPPGAWLNASTATWYRHAEDRPQTEWSGEPGDGFSCEVARAWEEAFFAAAVPAATRKLALRIGMVLGNEPGTVVDVLRRLTRGGLGGTLGPGTQRVSWIHLEDLLRAVNFLLDEPSLEGIFNVTAPSHPTNRELMRDFRQWLGMPLGLPATRWMLETGAWLLRTETELVLKSRWGDPQRLREEGFHWRWPELPAALADLGARPGVDGFFRTQASRSLGARAWLPSPTP